MVARKLLPYVQHHGHSEAGNGPWYHPDGVGSAGMQDAKVKESWKLPPRFQRKVWEAKVERV